MSSGMQRWAQHAIWQSTNGSWRHLMLMRTPVTGRCACCSHTPRHDVPRHTHITKWLVLLRPQAIPLPASRRALNPRRVRRAVEGSSYDGTAGMINSTPRQLRAAEDKGEAGERAMKDDEDEQPTKPALRRPHPTSLISFDHILHSLR